MKKFLELGNRFADQSDWKDFALTKFCLCAMGVIIGLQIPRKYKRPTILTACCVFMATYVPLMGKMLCIAKVMTGGAATEDIFDEEV